MRTRAWGYSLIEMMVVLAIIGIVLRIAIPAFQGFLATMSISSRTSDLLADLSLARQTALTQGTRVVVCGSMNPETTPACDATNAASWANGRIIFADVNANGTYDAGDRLIKVTRPVSAPVAGTPAHQTVNISLKGSGFSNAVAFGSNGLRVSLGSQTFTGWGVFVICQTGYSGRSVWLDGAGRVAASAASANPAYMTQPCP